MEADDCRVFVIDLDGFRRGSTIPPASGHFSDLPSHTGLAAMISEHIPLLHHEETKWIYSLGDGSDDEFFNSENKMSIVHETNVASAWCLSRTLDGCLEAKGGTKAASLSRSCFVLLAL